MELLLLLQTKICVLSKKIEEPDDNHFHINLYEVNKYRAFERYIGETLIILKANFTLLVAQIFHRQNWINFQLQFDVLQQLGKIRDFDSINESQASVSMQQKVETKLHECEWRLY